MSHQESVGNCPNKRSWLLTRLLYLSQFLFLEQLKEKSGPHEKRHWNTEQEYAVVILPVVPQSDL